MVGIAVLFILPHACSPPSIIGIILYLCCGLTRFVHCLISISFPFCGVAAFYLATCWASHAHCLDVRVSFWPLYAITGVAFAAPATIALFADAPPRRRFAARARRRFSLPPLPPHAISPRLPLSARALCQFARLSRENAARDAFYWTYTTPATGYTHRRCRQ